MQSMAFLHENIILPLSDLLQGEQVHKYLRLLKEAEGRTPAQMKSFQQERLRELMFYAATEVPFYRDWFHDHKLDPQTATLSQLPIVSKTIMRQEGIDRFTAKHFPIKQRITSRSSGSTGEPFSYLVSKKANSVNTAAKLRTWYQAGYRLGDKYMKIANGERQGKLKKWQDHINRCVFVPFYSIDDVSLRNILDTIEKERPLYIRSYPAPIYLLARYDSYSCEGTPNTYETPDHDGYHVCGYYGIIEILDNEGHPITDGIGRVVSTDLWSLAHPFIRYDTQDLVEVRNGKIIRIMGRESDAYLTHGGETYTVHNFSHYFLYDIQGVESYQIVHHRDGRITFNIVTNNEFESIEKQRIVDYWQPKLGTAISVNIVDSIPLMHNNKRQTIIHEP